MSDVPDPVRLSVEAVRRIAEEEGPGRVYFVGGCVRDRILGRKVVDVDLAVLGAVERVVELLTADLGGTVFRHVAFETAEIVPAFAVGIDVARMRRESYASPGVLPTVEPAGLEEDLARRDFTINALAEDASRRDFDEVVDLHGGRGDLANRLLRPLHDGSYVEDPTRLLRGVDLEARLEFTLCGETSRQVEEGRSLGAFDAVSPARRRQAWRRLLADGAKLSFKVARLAEFGVLAEWMPEFCWHDSLVTELERVEAAGRNASGEGDPEGVATAVLATLLACGGGNGSSLVADGEVSSLMSWPATRERLTERLAGAPTAGRRTECLDGLTAWQRLALAAVDQPVVAEALSRYETVWRHVSLTISGADLVARGVPPGRDIGEALRRVRRARIDRRIEAGNELESAMRWLTREVES